MKNFLKYLFGILCLLTIGVAQAQFNYVGLIKDVNGNPVSSQNLSMRISILDESQNIDYQESHTVSSSADSIVDLVIGNGTVISGLFSELDWSRTFYLKDEVDFGNGYVTMGIEAIKPVPLASYALNSNRNLVDENDNLLVNNDHNTSTDESNNANLHNTKNVGLGPHALESNTTGWYNVAVGWNALKENTEGHDNVAFGPRTLQQNTTGAYNAALGYNSLRNNTTGGSNTALGAGALVMNTEGNDNVGVGYAAMYNNATGDANVALGNHALNDNTSGSENTAIGWGALINTENGGGNVAVGTHTGQYLANNSNNNTFLGDNSGTTKTNSSTSIFNATAVGSKAKVTESNAMSFGDSNVTKWAFGLNTTDSGKVIQVGSNSGNGNGAYLTAGGVWTDASSILFKTNFIDLDNDWIKRQIAKLKIRRWDYKETDETHIGPTAEEFIDLFSVGIETDKQHLSTLDVAGVALKGVQAVIQENQELKEENAALEQQYQDLKELLTQVLQRIEKLEQQ